MKIKALKGGYANSIMIPSCSIIPVRGVYPVSQKKRITRDLLSNRREVFETDDKVLKDHPGPEEKALFFSSLPYGNLYCYFADLASALYTAYTRGETFLEVKPLVDGNNMKPERTVFTLPREAIYKLFFGPLVNDHGHAIPGAGPVIKEARKYIDPVLKGMAPEPVAAASVQKTVMNEQTGENRVIKTVVFGKPVRIHKWTKEIIQVELDHYFFPILNQSQPPKASDLYINQVAGLTAFLAFGRYLMRKRTPGRYPMTPTARRFILTCQAVSEMRGFAPGMSKEREEDKVSILLHPYTLGELYPRCIEPTGRISFNEFFRFCLQTGKIYNAALNETGITGKLSKNILILADQETAGFKDRKSRLIGIKGRSTTQGGMI